jgi:signal transduction protein with GAF and PtsI domain
MAVDKNKSLYVFKSTGWDSATERKLKSVKIPLGNKIAGLTASKNSRIFVKNIDECYELDIDYDFIYKNQYETKSFVSLPIFGHNRVVAVLNLTDKTNGEYLKGELEILNIIVMLCSKIFELLQIKKKHKLINN